MKVLVTGGAGFIGSHVVEVLNAQGARVFVLDDFSHAECKNLDGLQYELICGDIKENSLFKKLPRVDAVIHEAAVTDTTLADDTRMMMVNFEGFKNVLNFCSSRNIKLVYASSAGTYGDGPSPMRETQGARPLNTYAFSKYMCDVEMLKAIKGKGMPLIVGLRYFNVYGPREYHKEKSASMIYQLYLQMKANKAPRIFKHGEQKRDFIYVKDVASFTACALSLKKSAVINIGTGAARSFNDIIAILNKELKKNLSPDYFDNPYTSVYQNHTEADITFLKQCFKNAPAYSLEKGIHDYVHTFLNNK